jgi:RNA polymerase sigma-70 factor, ECF subfamily
MNEARRDRESFEQWMGAMRPRLHRYCARMVGSAIDGEDIVQEALFKATEAWETVGAIEKPEPWLFRIAHNAALDALRRRRRQERRRVDADLETIGDPTGAADARVAAAASLAAFMRLPAAQRSTVVLIDVLGHSADETAEILSMTLAAIKAALRRGRLGLRRLAADAERGAAPRLETAETTRLRAYADRFNARDFDALRALLAEDVRLDLFNRRRLVGRKDVSLYFTHYGQNPAWRISVCRVEGRPALAVTDPSAPARYVILLDWAGDRIAAIRDFRFAPYAMESLDVALLD